MDFRYDLHDQILRKRRHLRPVFNIRTKLDLYIRICFAFAVEHTIRINILIKMILLSFIFYIKCRSRRQISFICRCRRNGTSIHKSNRRNLTALKLASFTVREVSRCMTDRERIICRCISRSETRTAKCCFYNCSRFHKIGYDTIFHKFHINRRTCRIYAERKCIRSDIMTFDDICCRTDIFKTASRTSCDNSLIYIEFSVSDLVLKRILYSSVKTYESFLLYVMKDV